MKRFAFAVILFLVASSPLAAVDFGMVAGDRIAVLVVQEDGARLTHDDLGELIGRVTARRLEKEGFATVLLPRSADELVADGLKDAVGAAWILEIAWSDGRARTWGGIAGGTEGVGAEVGVVTAHLAAEIRLYDARTLEMVDRFEVDSRATTPALTGIGVGGRWSWLWASLPWGNRQVYGRAAGALAVQIYERVAPGRERIADGR